MRVRIVRRGPAGKYEMWGRCRDPGLWPAWMAGVIAVDADGPVLRAGLEGELRLAGGVTARFDVLDVDERATTWTRVVRLGPASLRVEQRVDEGFGSIEAIGPAIVVLAYAPLARRSLDRLLRRGAG
jgi:hypothetical protein